MNTNLLAVPNETIAITKWDDLNATERRLVDVGVWDLITSHDIDCATGQIIKSRGERPTGRIIYGPGLFMAAQVMDDGRPLFTCPNPAKRRVREVRAAFNGYTAYFGRFEIDEAKGAILHRMEGNLVPNEVGTTRTRFYSFCQEELTLTTPEFMVRRRRRVRVMIWKPARAGHAIDHVSNRDMVTSVS